MNWFVELVGGRDTRLGRLLYTPTIQEQADERYKDLSRRRLRLEMEQDEKGRHINQLKRRIKRQWTSDRKEQARQSIRDLRRSRAEYAGDVGSSPPPSPFLGTLVSDGRRPTWLL